MQNGSSEHPIGVDEIDGHHCDYPWASSIEALTKANVLLAADVIYLVNSIPDLVATVSKFLTQEGNGDDERMAIFAVTFRKKNTFALFEKELEEHKIVCSYDSSIEDLPNIFPCYWNQPRTDVRVCTMRIVRSSSSIV